jgi:hypothetical protein
MLKPKERISSYYALESFIIFDLVSSIIMKTHNIDRYFTVQPPIRPDKKSIREGGVYKNFNDNG